MKKNYLTFVLKERDKNGKEVTIQTSNLSVAFINVIEQVKEQDYIPKPYDEERTIHLAQFLEKEISWESEKRVWEYIGNCYMNLNHNDSLVNFCVNYWVGGDLFFQLSNEELKQKMNFSRWLTFEELSKVHYPDWK